MAASATPGDDLWEPGQAPESRARRHNKPRLSFFTPMKVAGGPVNAIDVGSTGVTVGEYVGGGSFCEVDKWNEAKERHRRLKGPWVGYTYFLNKG